MMLVSQDHQAEAQAEVDHGGHLFLGRVALEKGLLVAAGCVEAFSFRMKLALEQLRESV